MHGLDPSEALVQLEPRSGEAALRTEDVEEAIRREGERLAVVVFSGVQYYTGERGWSARNSSNNSKSNNENSNSNRNSSNNNSYNTIRSSSRCFRNSSNNNGSCNHKNSNTLSQRHSTFP